MKYLLLALALAGCSLRTHTLPLPDATGRAQLTTFSQWPTLCGVVVQDAKGQPVNFAVGSCVLFSADPGLVTTGAGYLFGKL